MKLNDAQIRDLFDAERGEPPAIESGSIDASLIQSLREGTIAPEKRERLIDVLASSNEAVDRFKEAASQPTPLPWYRRHHWLSMVAACLCVVTISSGFWWLRSDTGETSVTRALSQQASPANNDVLLTAPLQLRWSTRQAVPVRVILRDERAAIVWRSPLTEGRQIALPEKLRQDLKAGQRYQWQLVTATTAPPILTATFTIQP